MNQYFPEKLVLVATSKPRRWCLLKPFIFKEPHSETVYEVPAGFETDFASVPRFFWRLLPPWGKYGHAAVVHDWLYAQGGCSRAWADLVFLHAMELSGVNWVTRHAMYQAVRLFGGPAWRKHRAKEE